jgi:hypothetical protein
MRERERETQTDRTDRENRQTEREYIRDKGQRTIGERQDAIRVPETINGELRTEKNNRSKKKHVLSSRMPYTCPST